MKTKKSTTKSGCLAWARIDEKGTLWVCWNRPGASRSSQRSEWFDTYDKGKNIYTTLTNWDELEEAIEAVGAKKIASTSFASDWGDGDVDTFCKKYYDFSEVEFEHTEYDEFYEMKDKVSAYKKEASEIMHKESVLKKELIVQIHELCEKYGEDGVVDLEANGYDDLCVIYDGGNHPEYASNAFSKVYKVKADIYERADGNFDKIFVLETEDSPEYESYRIFDFCEIFGIYEYVSNICLDKEIKED